MKIGVTGSSGFIGQNAVKYLKAKGYDVVGFDKNSPVEPFFGGFTNGLLTDRSVLSRWMFAERIEVLLHLGARTDLLGVSPADYAANTIGVENIIHAANETPSVRRVLFASSRMVCRIDHIPTNFTDYSPPNQYGRSKMEGEQIVRNAKCRFEWTVFRPTSIWGPGFGIPYRNFFDQIRAHRFVHVAGHHPAKSFGFIGNTVFQLEKLIVAPAVEIDRRFFYTGDYEPLQLRIWADLINEEFGSSAPIREVPYSILKCAALFGDVARTVSGREVFPLTSFRLNNLIQNMVYPQLTELAEITGPLPHDYRTGTKETVRWILEN